MADAGPSGEARPVDITSFLSVEGAARKKSTLRRAPAPAARATAAPSSPARTPTILLPPGHRELAEKFAGVPGAVHLNGGFPSPELFPYECLSADLRGGAGRIEVGAGADAAAAQQYALAGTGHPPLVAWLRAHVAELHAPPGESRDVLVTSGACQCLDAVFSTFLSRGDPLLVEEYTFQVGRRQPGSVLFGWAGAAGWAAPAMQCWLWQRLVPSPTCAHLWPPTHLTPPTPPPGGDRVDCASQGLCPPACGYRRPGNRTRRSARCAALCGRCRHTPQAALHHPSWTEPNRGDRHAGWVPRHAVV